MLSAIVTAGGSGVRFGGEKITAIVCGEPLLYHTLRRVARVEGLAETILVLPPERIRSFGEEHGDALEALSVSKVVPGGATRQDSVENGLAAAEGEIVLVHDAVRPLFSVAAANRAVAAARESGAAILAVPARDTLKRVDAEHRIVATVPRSDVWQAETPQVVRRAILLKAYRRAAEDGFAGTDEASLVERTGTPVTVIRGAPHNIKVTEPEDVELVAALLRRE
jgi:2-C-methyl-D-erythritol 4-phosphate cytidylyltransferase/2-C-methyl-D-erythritol 4-phosphate cytidylyltransferase/2-C-methyl-D-erythritol 2,4-cyclodiphosphate synthase